MKNFIYHRITLVLILMLAAFAVQNISAQTTEFTYQGSLKDNASPANANYDFEFALFDGGGVQLGPTLSRNTVAVANGIFSVSLDFGNQFPGTGRFLEIRVRPSGGGALTTLTPRQPLNSAPYSVKSLNADSAANAANATNATTANNALNLGGVTASQYLLTNGNGSSLTNLNAASIATGTLSNLRLGQIPTANIADSAVTSAKIAAGQVVKSLNSLRDDVTLAAGSNITITPAGNTLTIASTGGSVNAILNQTTLQPSANFNISGSGTAGGQLTGGVINATTQYNLNNLRILSNAGVENLFVGGGAGVGGSGNSFFGYGAGNLNTAGSQNTFFGTSAGRSNSDGVDNAFVGHRAGYSNMSGFGNTFVGTSAGTANQSGNDNAFFGRQAGATNTIGSENAFFGKNAGYSNIVGSNLTMIGYYANVPSNTTLYNATAIGDRAFVSQSNSLILGSINGVNNAFQDTSVGIGTTAPTATLTVFSKSNTAADNTATFQATNIGPNQSHIHYGTNGDWFIRSAAVAGKVILQDTGGRVGIGTTAPDQTLSLGVGNASKPSGGSWLTFSDERLKMIGGRFTPGLKAVMQLQPLHYQYKADNALGIKSEGEHVGFSAQSVERVIPEAVTKNEQGYRLVNNDPIMWAMLNGIQEQQEQIVAQQKQIATLRSANAALNMRVRAVEKRLPKKRGAARRLH